MTPGRKVILTNADVMSAPTTPEPWRGVRLADLGLPPGIQSRLQDQGIDTLGGLSTYVACWPITKIPRIGPTARATIETAVRSWWATHQDLTAGRASMPHL